MPITIVGSWVKMEKHIDPLYIIFEKKLFDEIEYLSDQDFIFAVARDYLDFIKSKGAIIPDNFFEGTLNTILENLETMLIKKIYGCHNVTEYRKMTYLGKEEDIELARQRYNSLKKAA